MKSLFLSCAASVLVVSGASAQAKNLAERLGLPRDAKLLILHADDLGVAHSVNAASFAALDNGAVSSASIMMPTPWVTEVAAYAKKNPRADLGLHLTITSEWDTYRWGSVAPRDEVPSLLDSTGIFPNETAPVVARAKPAEVERELRAQVERALAFGIHPTHLDSHRGANFTTPELMAVYVKVAHDYHLPFLATLLPTGAPPAQLGPNDIVVDAVIGAGPNTPADQWAQFYLDAIRNLKPGLTEIIVHLGHDDAELQAVMVNHEPWGSAWRQRDYDVVNSAAFRKALADNHVTVVTWRQLYDAAQKR